VGRFFSCLLRFLIRVFRVFRGWLVFVGALCLSALSVRDPWQAAASSYHAAI
jgi:hypothetical protein